MSVTKPLHDEHQDLLPHIEALRAAAEAAAMFSATHPTARRGADTSPAG